MSFTRGAVEDDAWLSDDEDQRSLREALLAQRAMSNSSSAEAGEKSTPSRSGVPAYRYERCGGLEFIIDDKGNVYVR